MEAVRALFDSNIVIDFLNAIEQARAELGRYKQPAISVITWIEVMAGAKAGTEEGTRSFLAGLEQIGVTSEIADRAVALRRSERMRLPDAIILATAQTENILLVTRDTKGFGPEMPGVRIPYNL
ncbi:MAG: type II toxin-antitoxin system VapC family toxin [Betaproteobacteria bacterium]